MRGESRLCRGSIEPLRRLPDGALATRRIVSFLWCAAAAAARRRRAAQKACSSAAVCRLTTGSGVFLFVSRREGVTQK